MARQANARRARPGGASTLDIEPSFGSIPRPYINENHWLRFHHDDLHGYETYELEVELHAVIARLRYERSPAHRAWLVERRNVVKGEQARRRERRP